MTESINCDWCGDEIESESDYVRVQNCPDGQPSGVLATFHMDTCFPEARDYGWDATV